jgi:hypothetical protein
VFASPKMKGKQPYWPETPLKCFCSRLRSGWASTKQIGWHSFRRTFAKSLKGRTEDVKTIQELMRLANSRSTRDVYAQALTSAKRAAHLKVVEMIRPAAESGAVPLPELRGIAVPRVSEPLGWANCGGRGGLAGGLTHKRLSVEENLPGRIELLQEIKIKNIAGQHGAAMLSSCGK